MSGVDVVAAFDFDGTLSPRDNFVPFLRRFAGTTADAEAFAAPARRGGEGRPVALEPQRAQGGGAATSSSADVTPPTSTTSPARSPTT